MNPEEEDGPKVKNRINPLYKNDQDDDTDSDSSGDNVIIGVEDQDDFKDYQDRYDVSIFSCLFYFSCPDFLDISGPLFWSSYS